MTPVTDLVTVADIAAALESWAPPGWAMPWDNTGLQVGRPARTVTRGLVALDCTPQAVAEARSAGAEMVVSHHPLLFKPPKTFTDREPVASVALDLAESGIALYSIHTNLDAVRSGVSFALAEQLGLLEISFLQPLDIRPVRKLVVYVPVTHADAVRSAMGRAGTGRIGAYDDCAFELSGAGYFRPRAGANPFTGVAGGPIERVEETRIEVEVLSWELPGVLAALREAHPYEEVAFDVIPVDQPYRDAGLGAVANLPAPESLTRFLERVSGALGVPALRYVGDPLRAISRVAVCGGAGIDLLPAAVDSGADAYVTSDITYHRWFDALTTAGEPRIALVDAGHYESEAIAETILVSFLRNRFPTVEWNRTSMPTNPVATFTGR